MNTGERILKKGTEIFLSKIGHRNFYYPNTENSILLKEDLEADPLPYISGRPVVDNKRLTAFKVRDIIKNDNNYVVIWTWI